MDEDRSRAPRIAVIAVAVIVAIVLVVWFAIWMVHRDYTDERADCLEYGQATHRTVTFTNTGEFDQCLTPDGQGHLIPIDKLRG